LLDCKKRLILLKDWCKHRYGFVNFDDEYMYLTSSGNWSDVDDLGELNEEGFRSKSSFQRNKTILFLTIIILAGVFLIILKGRSVEISVFIVVAFTIFAVFQYFASNLSLNFKIPYSKIQSIDVREQAADITFTDFNGKEEKHHLQGLNGKGISLFYEISDNYLSKTSEMEKSDPTNWEV